MAHCISKIPDYRRVVLHACCILSHHKLAPSQLFSYTQVVSSPRFFPNRNRARVLYSSDHILSLISLRVLTPPHEGRRLPWDF